MSRRYTYFSFILPNKSFKKFLTIALILGITISVNGMIFFKNFFLYLLNIVACLHLTEVKIVEVISRVVNLFNLIG